jgi:LmbE family N-acetylglucosaminyl deacetylase
LDRVIKLESAHPGHYAHPDLSACSGLTIAAIRSQRGAHYYARVALRRCHANNSFYWRNGWRSGVPNAFRCCAIWRVSIAGARSIADQRRVDCA